MRGQPDDSAERIFYCLRQHLDIWMIIPRLCTQPTLRRVCNGDGMPAADPQSLLIFFISTYRLSSRRKFWATHRSRSRLPFRFRGSVLAEVRKLQNRFAAEVDFFETPIDAII